MSINKFAQSLLFALKNNIQDDRLLSEDIRGFRSGYFFGLIIFLNKVINYFNFKNEIIFTNKKPYIKINEIYLEIVNKYFLKMVKEPYISDANLIINFLNKYKFKPKIILDVGACWGEFSLILGKHFNKSQVYSIEGSEKNYNILCKNINFKLNKIQNVEPFNYIVSDTDNYKFIKNIVGTTNIVKNNIKKEDLNYSKVNTVTLKKFLNDNKITHVDFLKLDIEGHELKLIKDILNIDIQYGQIEIININSLEDNFKFLNQLSAKYKLFDSQSFDLINKEDFKNYIISKLDNSIAFDIFIISKKIYKY